jgi:hypothetical protein
MAYVLLRRNVGVWVVKGEDDRPLGALLLVNLPNHSTVSLVSYLADKPVVIAFKKGLAA